MTGVTISLDKVGGLLASLKSLTKSRVLVGVPAEDAGRNDDGEPINNAALAFIHDNGAPEINIPARPFMAPGIARAEDAIVKQMKAGAQKVLDGKPGAVDQTMHRVGLTAQSAIRNQINDGPFVPLSPRTLADRRRRGRTGDQPLIDTGQLRNSINYVIRGA